MMKLTVVLRAGAFAAVALLAACSSEPSEGDLKQALETKMEEVNKEMAGTMTALSGKADPSLKVELHSVKKVGCKESPKGGYFCDLEVDMSAPLQGRVKQVANHRFVKGSNGWVMSDTL